MLTICILYQSSGTAAKAGQRTVQDENFRPPGKQEIAAAIRKSIPLLEKTAQGTISRRKCYTCHGHPFVALVAAEKPTDFEIDPDILKSVLDHTTNDLDQNQESYIKYRGQAGGNTRAGYALWTLSAGGVEASPSTELVVDFLLRRTVNGHWRPSANREPSEGSHFTSTFVALKAINEYVNEAQQPRANEVTKAALDWLKITQPESTEDFVFRLLALQETKAEKHLIEQAAEALLKRQKQDGGWSQSPAHELSDAYSTGSALYSLYIGGGIATTAKSYRTGLRYLLDSQHPDGSWHVVSTASPIQRYYESGYPHGEDQFISMAAGGWATMALIYAIK